MGTPPKLHLGVGEQQETDTQASGRALTPNTTRGCPQAAVAVSLPGAQPCHTPSGFEVAIRLFYWTFAESFEARRLRFSLIAMPGLHMPR